MATDFTSQITAIYQAVEYRNPPAAELAVYNAALQSGTMTIAQVQSAVINDPFTSTVVDAVIREYQAAFNRVPDQAGVSYWVGQIASNPSMLPQLNTIFANSTEFTARFGATATTTANPALVTALYTNVYGRAPDSAGLAYWSTSGLNAAQLLQAFANAQEFVTQTTPAIQAFQAQEIAGTAPTTGSLFAIVPPNVPGSTLALTTATDVLNGTAGNDTFVGDQSNALAPQVSIADTINGGAGTDTFNEFVGGQAFVLPQLNSVEVVNVIGATVAEAINTTTASGITNVNVKNDAVGGDTITVGNGVTVGFDNVVKAGGGLGLETVNFAATATTGNLDVRNGTNLDGGLTVTGAALTSVNINSTGSAANTIAALNTPGNVKSLTLTGDQKLTITGALNNAINSVDGSSATGAEVFKLGATTSTTDTVKTGSGNDVVDISGVGADAVTVNLGAGNDVLKVGAALNTFLPGTVLDGGAGTDVVNITSGATLTKASAAYLTNFETLDVSGGAGTYDVTLGGFTKVQIDQSVSGPLTGAVALNNLPSTGFALDIMSAKGTNFAVGNNVTFNLKDFTGTSDNVTINLTSVDGNNNGVAEGNITTGTMLLQGIETVTVNANTTTADTGVSASKYVETITLDDATYAVTGTLQTLVITGNESVNVLGTLGAANQLGGVTLANFTKVDASASTGNITIDYSNAPKAVTYLGSAGVDTINASDGGTIYGAGGNDQITLGGATPFKAAIAAVNEVETLTATAGAAAGNTVSVSIGNLGGGAPITVTTGAAEDISTAAKLGAVLAADINANAAASAVVTAASDGAGHVTLTYNNPGDAANSTFNGDADANGVSAAATFAETTKGVTPVAAVNAATSLHTDTLVYKAATDAQLTTAGSNVSSASTVETVTNFMTTNSAPAGTAHDFIDISSIGGFTGYASGAKTITGVDPLSGTFAASQTNFFNDGVGNRGVVLDTVGGNTYVFVDANHDGNFTAGSDLVIKLAGVTNVTATDFHFG